MGKVIWGRQTSTSGTPTSSSLRLYDAILQIIRRPRKPLKFSGLSTNNGEHFVQFLKSLRRPRSLEDREDGLRQDLCGIMERVVGVVKQTPADHIPRILKLQEMMIFDGKPPLATLFGAAIIRMALAWGQQKLMVSHFGGLIHHLGTSHRPSALGKTGVLLRLVTLMLKLPRSVPTSSPSQSPWSYPPLAADFSFLCAARCLLAAAPSFAVILYSRSSFERIAVWRFPLKLPTPTPGGFSLSSTFLVAVTVLVRGLNQRESRSVYSLLLCPCASSSLGLSLWYFASQIPPYCRFSLWNVTGSRLPSPIPCRAFLLQAVPLLMQRISLLHYCCHFLSCSACAAPQFFHINFLSGFMCGANLARQFPLWRTCGSKRKWSLGRSEACHSPSTG